jgi:hypothetical protein
MRFEFDCDDEGDYLLDLQTFKRTRRHLEEGLDACRVPAETTLRIELPTY